MARKYTAIKRKTEDAIEALINKLKGTDLAGVTFYKGFDFSQELKTPRLELITAKATDSFGNIGTATKPPATAATSFRREASTFGVPAGLVLVSA